MVARHLQRASTVGDDLDCARAKLVAVSESASRVIGIRVSRAARDDIDECAVVQLRT